MNWDQIFAVFAITFTNFSIVFALYFNLDKKIEEQRKETLILIQAIRQEMRDFYGKLALQDAEFKSHILYFHNEINKKQGG
jgi:hypothetical protein